MGLGIYLSHQTPHTLNDTDHSLVIILPTVPHLSPNVAEASAIGALVESPTRSIVETQTITIMPPSPAAFQILQLINSHNQSRTIAIAIGKVDKADAFD